MNENLKRLIEFADGQTALANALRDEKNPITQAHVWKWVNTTKLGIPAEFVIRASEAVNWQVTPHELRPDIYPHPQDGLPEHMREVA